jgi:hypothetical protein
VTASPIRWRPVQATARMLAVVAADDDASVLETVAGPARIAALVPLDNNLGHRRWDAVTS